MDCTRLFSIPDRRGRCIGFALLSLTIVSLAAGRAQAQPFEQGPLEVSRLRQLTEFRADWSATDQYELGNAVELVVTIEGLLLPEEGNAELLFSTVVQATEALALSQGPGQIHHATLQIAAEVRRLRLDGGVLRPGLQARITGWPASDHNRSSAVLLVDEIELLRKGRRYALHDYPRMRRIKDKPEDPGID